MTRSAKSILKQAVALNPVDRAELIESLYRSFDLEGTAQIDMLWADEVESRLDAYKAGKLKADTVKAVFERIGKR